MPLELYLKQIIKPIITNEGAIKITQSTDDMGVLLTLTVAKEDMGNVIGKGGETAKIIRTLLRIAGMKSNARVSLKITEPDGSDYKPRVAGAIN